MIESLWPSSDGDELSDGELASLYAYPHGDQLWVRTNCVVSLDGATSVDGRSGPLSGPADKRVFRLLRALSDVILVGAGTVRAEGYGDTHLDIGPHTALRREQQLSDVPPIAVVTRFCDLDESLPLFTHNVVPPLVMTSDAAPPQRRSVLTAAGAEVVAVGCERHVSLTRVLDELARRGLRRVLCEGGPQLLAGLLAADAVDEYCLTVAPMLVGGGVAARSGNGRTAHAPATMTMASMLLSYDSLLLRYRRFAR